MFKELLFNNLVLNSEKLVQTFYHDLKFFKMKVE